MAATTQVRLLVRSGSHTELHRLLVSQWWVNTCELTSTAPPQLARLPPPGGVDAGFRPWSTRHGAWVLQGGWHHRGGGGWGVVCASCGASARHPWWWWQQAARWWQLCAHYAQSFRLHPRPHRLVVRASRCGHDNPGSTPGAVRFVLRAAPTAGSTVVSECM